MTRVGAARTREGCIQQQAVNEGKIRKLTNDAPKFELPNDTPDWEILAHEKGPLGPIGLYEVGKSAISKMDMVGWCRGWDLEHPL
jgi:hypothetical protein